MRYIMKFGLFLVFVLLFAGCSQADTFVPLPPPVEAKYPLTQLVQTVGSTEQVRMQSPIAAVEFGQTGDFAGAMKIEEVVLKQRGGMNATMLGVRWGDWFDSTISRAESHDPQGRILGGWITETLPDASILQWLALCGRCTIDRSRLIFEYISPEPGATPILRNVYYLEEWGLTNRAPVALGGMYRWNDADNLFPRESQWGFWESTETPFTTVTAGLAKARTALKTSTPDFAAIDHDGPNEFIGRQTAMTIQAHGKKIGSVSLDYDNTWGAMPNTPIIGKGALSRITWNIDGEYYAIAILTPAFSPEPTSLYVFCTSQEAADYVTANQQAWPMLYEKIRRHQIEGAEFAIYSIGHVGRITKSTGDSVVTVGEGGGVYYSLLGNPGFEEVDSAYRHLSMLGLGGIKALGFYYATHEGSGNGLEYYLAVLRLVLAPEDEVLEVYGVDVGTLDRVGYLPR